MGMQPNIARRRNFMLKECTKCSASLSAESFTKTKSIFYGDGVLPICNECIKEYLNEYDFDWEAVDKICQWADIPFVPKEWEKVRNSNGDEAFPVYANIFNESEYEGLGWKDYYAAFKELKEKGTIEDEIPGISDQKKRKMRERWGANYDDEALRYLEELYNGLTTTQNINGALQVDQAIKICKMSYEIDNRIREGADFDKLLASYDKLVKAAEFTPKNVKNINDFDSVGELVRWMEKKGWRNTFYDKVSRDVVDETIKNIQNFNQRLYVNESGIGEEITSRLEALKNANELERQQDDYYGLNKQHDLDEYENSGYNSLFGENDSFAVELEEDNNG